MTAITFNEGWMLSRNPGADAVAVRLPHDAMISETRSADAITGNHGGYFPSGVYRYQKTWDVPADADTREYRLYFEGVYGHTTVSVSGQTIAQCISGYRGFYASLNNCQPNTTVTIDVLVDNSKAPNTRWYSGTGINRPVWLDVRPSLHIADDGVRIVTRSIKPSAQVDIEVLLGSDTDERVQHPESERSVKVTFCNDNQIVSTVVLPIAEGSAKGTVTIPNAKLWSAESPHLYAVTVELIESGAVVDTETVRTGLRTIDVDAEQGLRINGEPVLLRGACVHSDNGLLGTVTLPAAEYRRARILKESGYNAIRASHNPFQRGFLDACDELGLYVMDELTDVWFQHKTKYDNAEHFDTVWPADAAALIAEDRNRPSVIMYSIGNEISETATEKGVEAAAAIHAYFKKSDPTRPTTLAVNLLLNVMASKGSSPFEKENYAGSGDDTKKAKPKKEATSTAANMVTAKLGAIMGLISRLPVADRVSRDAFAQVDIAGYNYAYGRYKGDRKKYPQRVIMGSESMPGDLPAIWKRVTTVPGVIGDFMWTGWDYLGEAGIGTWSYGDEPGGINKPYPALIAGCGAIDITGRPGAPTLLARAVWGLLSAPEIAVRPLMHTGKRTNKSPWRSTDAISSWAWSGASGKASVEVYSCDDKVELFLNGRSLGRKRAGAKAGFVSRFTVAYTHGELTAVGYRKGKECGRTTLRSADAVSLQLTPEKSELCGPDDLAYIDIALADVGGVVESMASDRLTIEVNGAAQLIGFGCADPNSIDNFSGTHCATYLGRAQAIVRGTHAQGVVTVTVRSERHGEATIQLHAV